MMTQTHIVLAAAIFAKPGDRVRTSLAVLGGFLPDMTLTGLFIVARMQGVSAETIFGKLFWSESWSAMMAPGNSFVVFGAIFLLGLWLSRSRLPQRARFGALTLVFSVSALLHLITDFFLHVDDARVQFWPLSDYIFHSPVSYWDSRHYGNIFQPIELLLAIGCIVLLMRRFKGKYLRAILGICLILYVAIPVYFMLNHRGM